MAQEPTAAPKPPYNIAFATIRGFITKLRTDGMPSRIDKTLLKNTSGTVQAYTLPCLRFLGLINGNDAPTPAFDALVAAKSEEEEKPLWKTVCEKSYGEIFESGINLTAATEGEFYELLNKKYDYDGDTRRKCATFFANLAVFAGIPIGPYLKPKARGTAGRTKRRAPKEAPLPPAPPAPPPDHKDTKQDRAKMLLDKFPAFNPEWKDEIQKKWFEGYEKLLAME
ncbi:MAG TPA: DUF5343 domain-containing protein [Verrucomicrobiales bacterium]|nr:DUF5343 domain-containing protein [Verrucomicrobiales bacterium]